MRRTHRCRKLSLGAQNTGCLTRGPRERRILARSAADARALGCRSRGRRILACSAVGAGIIPTVSLVCARNAFCTTPGSYLREACITSAV